MDGRTLRVPINKLKLKEVLCIEKSKSVKDAISLMKKADQACVCVVENKRLVGIFTERDVLTKVIGHNRDCVKTKLCDVMTANPEYLLMDDEVAFALNRMHVGGFRHIPLVNGDGIPEAILSVQDIATYLIQNIDGQSV